MLSEFTLSRHNLYPHWQLADSRFDPRWIIVVEVRVAVCDLRIRGINIASTIENNVGTSSSFKEILAPG